MAFMKPQASNFSKQEALEYVISQHPEDQQDEIEPEAGWYSRLSASGYMDCTDWSGPFETEQEALDYIMDLFEVDENGDDLEDEE